ncbi:MAG: TIGR03960 family B12-binding radical SAM protein [Candidatus Aminicenantes bacterium]|nr:TIGR03960 family B12-binding radical SAM protein [Candidatus Aminicenantes bacterium]
MNAQELIARLQNPQAYIGREINSCRDGFDKNNINICLVFPDTYVIGMSHSGLKILYHLLNGMDGVHAERAFLPEPENLAVFKESGVTLFSLENRIALKEFDLIGFSLASELNFTNVLQVLALSGLPLLSAQRQQGFPLVGAGGIAVANPEPLRAIIDFFAFGDGEVIFPELIAMMKRARENKRQRQEILRSFAELEGVYVPSLYSLKKVGHFLVPDLGGRKIRKRICPDLNRLQAETREIVPICEVVFNRLNVEIARGCPQNCRFCQAKSYYAPFRARDLEHTEDFVGKALARTGFESFSLSSLSSGDYPYLRELLARIPALVQPDISFSIPSLRPSTLTEELLVTLARFRKTGLTIVPEAGSERLRRVLNKHVTDAEIFQALDFAWQHRWQKIKMYFMLGLPGETMDDIAAIAALLEQILARSRSRRAAVTIHVSFSTFVPKPHTPLQWTGRDDVSVLEEKVAYLKNRLKRHKNLNLDFHSLQLGIVETILARGDARVGDLLLQVFSEGEILTAWDAHFHFSVWEKWIRTSAAGDDFLAAFPLATVFPWDFIQLNFSRDYLAAEYGRALSAQVTAECSLQDCAACAGCFFAKKAYLASAPVPVAAVAPPLSLRYRRLRIHYQKKGDLRYLSHLAMMQYIERLLRKSGLLFKYSEGFHPRIKMASLPPLPVGAQGFAEVVEVFVAGDLGETEIAACLNNGQKDLRFDKACFVTDDKSLFRDLHVIELRFVWPPEAGKREDLGDYLLAGEHVTYGENDLELIMDYSQQGQERFARIYKLLDPERKWTANLSRTAVRFKNEN